MIGERSKSEASSREFDTREGWTLIGFLTLVLARQLVRPHRFLSSMLISERREETRGIAVSSKVLPSAPSATASPRTICMWLSSNFKSARAGASQLAREPPEQTPTTFLRSSRVVVRYSKAPLSPVAFIKRSVFLSCCTNTGQSNGVRLRSIVARKKNEAVSPNCQSLFARENNLFESPVLFEIEFHV